MKKYDATNITLKRNRFPLPLNWESEVQVGRGGPKEGMVLPLSAENFFHLKGRKRKLRAKRRQWFGGRRPRLGGGELLLGSEEGVDVLLHARRGEERGKNIGGGGGKVAINYLEVQMVINGENRIQSWQRKKIEEKKEKENSSEGELSSEFLRDREVKKPP